MGRNAETELLDDIVDLFKPYDGWPAGLDDSIGRDVVDLVKGRLISPDETDLILDTLQQARDAISSAGASLEEMRSLLPEGMFR